MTRRSASLLALAFLGFVGLGLPDGLLGVAWPSLRASFGLRVDALGPLLLAWTGGFVLSSFAIGRLLARARAGALVALGHAAVAAALLGYTIGEMEHPSETTPLHVLQTRLASLQAASEVTDLAMKTCGGAAFSRHLAVERIFRDARAGWVMAPTVDHLNDFIGKALTGLPLF